MKTRSKLSSTTKKTPSAEGVQPSARTLTASVDQPPHVFVLPKNTSPDARIVSLPRTADGSAIRHLVCPERGFFEFTRIAAPKRTQSSWLLSPSRTEASPGQGARLTHKLEATNRRAAEEEHQSPDNSEDTGYVLHSADLYVATPIDPLFVLLPALVSTSNDAAQEFLAPSDYLVTLIETSPQLRDLIEPHVPSRLTGIMQERLEAVCDCMDMGDDRLFALSLSRLCGELLSKARRIVSRGLPATLQGRFIKQVLDVPDLGMKREDSSISLAAEEEAADASSNTVSDGDSQETVGSADTSASITTAATSASTLQSANPEAAPAEIINLLQLRTAFDFMLASYVPPRLHGKLHSLLNDPQTSPATNFSSLDKHLASIESMKRQAHALRSLSENISRKRGAADDEESIEKAEAKRRKKEEEEYKKRSMSQGVKQLMKADTSGMKKLSAFFTKAAAKK